MAGSDTARRPRRFSFHNNARPTPVNHAGEHTTGGGIPERQGNRVPHAREPARALAAIYPLLATPASKKHENAAYRPSYLDDGGADSRELLICRQGHRGAAVARFYGVFPRDLAKMSVGR